MTDFPGSTLNKSLNLALTNLSETLVCTHFAATTAHPKADRFPASKIDTFFKRTQIMNMIFSNLICHPPPYFLLPSPVGLPVLSDIRPISHSIKNHNSINPPN